MMVTPLVLDIVIVNDVEKKAFILELTVPFEDNVHKQHEYKTNKYSHYEHDLKSYDVKLICFEIGARGLITPENKNRLKFIHKFLNKSIKCKDFSEKVATLSITSSYFIYTCRNQPTWEQSSQIGPT